MDSHESTNWAASSESDPCTCHGAWGWRKEAGDALVPDGIPKALLALYGNTLVLTVSSTVGVTLHPPTCSSVSHSLWQAFELRAQQC